LLHAACSCQIKHCNGKAAFYAECLHPEGGNKNVKARERVTVLASA